MRKLVFIIFFFSTVFVALSEDKIEVNEFPEISLGYSNLNQDNMQGNFANFGFGINFLFDKSMSFSGLFEVNGLFGTMDSKSFFGANVVPGLRFKIKQGKTFIKFDLLSGIGSVYLKDSISNSVGSYSIGRIGFGYDNISLELSTTFFTSRKLTLDKIIGIAIRYQF